MSQSMPSSPRRGCLQQDELQGNHRAKTRKRLSKQLSMRETARDMAWEKRRHQILRQGRMAGVPSCPSRLGEFREDITDEDLNDLKGSIELGFGFKEEDGQALANTLPALDLYFAVNRQVTTGSTGSTPRGTMSLSSSSTSLARQSSSSPSSLSPRSDYESWKICNPGDDPEQVKIKLRHWAQAVACSLKQSS